MGIKVMKPNCHITAKLVQSGLAVTLFTDHAMVKILGMRLSVKDARRIAKLLIDVCDNLEAKVGVPSTANEKRNLTQAKQKELLDIDQNST